VKILMDSSGWIEFFTGGPFAERYAAYLTPRHDIITPTVVLYDVYKKIKREKGEETALLFTGRLRATHVVQLTESIAYLAADFSMRRGLVMADAIVYATAKDHEADVVTGDADLRTCPELSISSKRSRQKELA
jgi:toxin FitB